MNTDAGRKYLWDALRAAERLARFTEGRTFVDYERDEMLRAAVERQFEIIGEAFAALRRASPELAATIPNLPRIVAFRNVLIHSYASVDDRLVWGVVEGALGELLALLARMLAATEEQGEGNT